MLYGLSVFQPTLCPESVAQIAENQNQDKTNREQWIRQNAVKCRIVHQGPHGFVRKL